MSFFNVALVEGTGTDVFIDLIVAMFTKVGTAMIGFGQELVDFIVKNPLLLFPVVVGLIGGTIMMISKFKPN